MYKKMIFTDRTHLLSQREIFCAPRMSGASLFAPSAQGFDGFPSFCMPSYTQKAYVR